MIQDQLVEYISSQLKLGVPREAVKSALVGAGWQAADVEDTLKKVESAASKPAQPAQPAQSAQPAGASSGASSPASIKVSDLMSASGSAMPFKASSPAAGTTPAAAVKSAAPKIEPTMKPLDLSRNKQASSMAIDPSITGSGGHPRGGRSGLLMAVAGGVLIAALGALAGYLYMENSGLAGKVATLSGTSTGVASRLASLDAQVQALNASNTALAAQAAALTAENEDLKANLSFAAVPLHASTSSEAVLVSGALSGSSKTSFKLTTPYGVVVYVSNSKDAKVSAALTPLVLGTSSVMLTGAHVPGSQYVTVTAVNGSALK